MNEERIKVLKGESENQKQNGNNKANSEDIDDNQIEENLNRRRLIGHKTRRNQRGTSLKDLTLNFIDYSIRKGDIYIDLNDCQRHLNVAKRRIYDITNVLEGKRKNYLKLIYIFFDD